MPEIDPPPIRRGRDHNLEARIQQLEGDYKLLAYKHEELASDFRAYEKHSQERMKWNTGMLLTFIGSILIPAVTIIITILSKPDVTP